MAAILFERLVNKSHLHLLRYSQPPLCGCWRWSSSSSSSPSFGTVSSMAANGVNGGDLKATFKQIYFRLKAELLEDPAFDFTDEARQWIDKMLDYNVPGGKLSRGLSVVESYKLLKKGSELTDNDIFLSCALGWSIEWLQAYFLVVDDIVDKSHTRRGQPCWYRVPKVGLIAANDGILLRNHIPRIIKRHFKGKPYYVDLLDLFNEVEFQTVSGQMLDLITIHEGEQDLSKYKLPVYNRIAQYKTAYYSFYLPVACALLISGENLDNFVDAKNILVEMGTYFQVQDDYLDCFGHPEVTGKIGTDIEDYKCSWLVMQALQRANENQLKVLSENYGKSDPDCIAKVKTIYRELDLQQRITATKTVGTCNEQLTAAGIAITLTMTCNGQLMMMTIATTLAAAVCNGQLKPTATSTSLAVSACNRKLKRAVGIIGLTNNHLG